MIRLALSWYIIGMILHYFKARFDIEPFWDNVYYFWEKTKDVLFIAAILFGKDRVKIPLIAVFVFVIIRLIWEFISRLTGLSANNTPIVALLLGILVLVCLVIFVNDLLRWRRSKDSG